MRRKYRNDLTAEQLRQVLSYDPKTGEFRWAQHRPKAPLGKIAGHVSASGYRQIRLDGVLYYAHRLAWLYCYGQWPREHIDHANCKRSDNRIENLREADDTRNSQNSRIGRANTSGFKGVSLAYGKWDARIKVNGIQICLGNYETPEEAHEAYKAAARKFFGEFARFE